jgi:citrate synthase
LSLQKENMPKDLTFSTQVSGERNSQFELRSVPLLQLIDEADFVGTLFLSITGRKPTDDEKKLFNALLVASMDHGINPASGFVPRVVAASGNDPLKAMASVFLALGPYHGGAVAAAMQLFLQIVEEGRDDLEAQAISFIKEYRSQERRLPGFGHPVYKDVDPRTNTLFALARQSQLDLHFLDLALLVETHLENEAGRKLVLNIDGALAAVLLTLGFQPDTGNALFALARAAGSIAHIMEEVESGDWVRRLPEEAVKYQPQDQSEELE